MTPPPMANRRHIREIALQALYQLEARGEADLADVQRSVRESPFKRDEKQAGLDLAARAWATRETADRLATELAPTWPSSRQPPVDRGILRLAWQEMASGEVPPRVAINEAVELAKTFSTERSPAFINGVLDKMMRRLEAEPDLQAAPENPEPDDAWLSDAVNQPPDETS